MFFLGRFILKIVFIISSLALVVFTASCVPVYTPNVVNAPLLTQKGEANISGHVGTNGFDFQSSFSLTPNIALMANGSFFRSNYEETNDYEEHYFGEGGIGWYKSLGQAGRLEAFAGYGYGKSKAEDEWYFLGPQTEISEAYYHRFFIQTDLGATLDFFDGGIAFRGCCLLFHKYIHNNLNYGGNDAYFFLEPVLFGRIGWKQVKMQMQMGLSFCLAREPIEYFPFLLSFGIHINLGRYR